MGSDIIIVIVVVVVAHSFGYDWQRKGNSDTGSYKKGIYPCLPHCANYQRFTSFKTR
jgi:hypothetical protein